MDRLEAMSLLVEAVEGGSLSAAARRFGVPLASVSRKIAELEALLNVRLLLRTTRRIDLTDAGRDYVAASKRILEEVGEAERTAAGEYRAPKGELVVTAPVAFGRLVVLPVVTGFLAAFPEVDVRLVLADGVVNLLEDHVDLAVRVGEPPESGLIAMRLGAIQRVVVGSPAYLERRGVPQDPQQLSRHDCVTFAAFDSPTLWNFASGAKAIAAPVRSRLIVNTAEAAVDAAVAGVGFTRIACYQAAQALRDGSLVAILKAFEFAPSPVNFIHAGGQGRIPLKLRAFLDFAAPRLRARLAA